MTGSAVDPALRIPDYELLQLVGRGSYGEVWMAHNALGSLRAVKVVWRKNFEDDRPYEREFRGIRKFEPVSRKHDGLIDLYHVGRNNDEGYFYYAMELADDAAPVMACEGEYRARTLREELRAKHRLPVDKAMEIGIKLASALVHLHAAGLVHRDIKPSNIIFVDGAPKLADIGLVAGISDARSFVGTEGFVPPEGPGTPAADIFSLGKVLYEASTGLDRNDFPKMPAMSCESAIDPIEFAELNEVLLKACDPSPQSRYRTAEELLADLLWIQGGRSLRRLRSSQRRTGILLKAGLAAGVIALIAVGFHFARSRNPYSQDDAGARTPEYVRELQRIEESFQKDEADVALAHLARLVQSEPTNRVATERLMATLTWRNFLVPSIGPIAVDGGLGFANFRHDEEEIVSVSGDGTMQFWNAKTGQQAWKGQAVDGAVTAADWTEDRTRLVVIGERQGRIYDTASRELVAEGLEHDSGIVSVQFSPDHRWILTGASNGTAQVWDARTARPFGKIFEHDGSIRRAMFNPKGEYVLTAGFGGDSIRIWDFPNGQFTSRLLREDGPIDAIAFRPADGSFATTSDDRTVKFWSPTGGYRGRLPYQNRVTAVTFSPDGSNLVTASDDGTVTIWNLGSHSGHIGAVGDPMRHRTRVRTVRYSPDGTRLLTLTEDGTVRLWDASKGRPVTEPMRHPQPVETVAFSPRGDRLLAGASSAAAGGLWLWNTTTRKAMGRAFAVPATNRTARLARQTGQLCIADGHSLRIWPHVESLVEPVTIDLSMPVEFFNLTADGTWGVVSWAQNAWIWDLSNQQSILGPLAHPAEILSAEFSPDKRRLAVATTDGHLVVWHLDALPDPPERRQFLPQPDHPQSTFDDGVLAVRFSPDGQHLLAACRNGKVLLFDVRTVKPVELPHKHRVSSAEFSRDGRRVVTSGDRYARVWDAGTGRPVGQAMQHDNEVLTGCFGPDGRRVLTTSRNGTARIWDAQTGRPVSEPLQHTAPVLVGCFTPDGARVATGTEAGKVRLWDTAIGQPLTDDFHYSGPVQTIEFTTDGSRLLVVPAVGDVELIEVLQVQSPAMPWLATLAEAVARLRVNERQGIESLPPHPLSDLGVQLNSLPDDAPNVRWAKWFVANPSERTISPDSTISLTNHLDELLRTASEPALREVILLEPAHALAHAQLARLLVGQEGRDREAEWHQNYARKLQPENWEIAEVCDKVAGKINALRSPSSPPLGRK